MAFLREKHQRKSNNLLCPAEITKTDNVIRIASWCFGAILFYFLILLRLVYVVVELVKMSHFLIINVFRKTEVLTVMK